MTVFACSLSIDERLQPKIRPLAESHSFRGSLSSEPDGITLPGWLNASNGTRSYDRLIRILELIRDNEENVRNILAKGAHVHTGLGKWPREHLKLWSTDRQLHQALHLALKRYTFTVRLTGTLFGQRWILSLYCKRRKDEFAWEAPYAYKALPGQTIVSVPTYFVSEGDAALAAVRLAEKGVLSRVRLCATCSEKWFFAKHSNYRFCSALCRERYFTNTQEYRAKKAQQMRKYRHNLSLKEQAEKKLL